MRPDTDLSTVRIGVDVGGTNTDAVLMRGRDVLASAKRPTTQDVRDGVVDAVGAVLSDTPEALRAQIAAVMIGTTQFVNAFVQRRHLSEVAAIRISLPKSDGVPPMVAWPEDLARAIGAHAYLVRGGSFYDGREYAELDERELHRIAQDVRQKGLKAIAITSNFAPIRPDIEERAAAVVRRVIPDSDITLSSTVGGIGLLDRENAAIVNASLTELSRKVVASLVAAFGALRLRAPLFLSQNDGTLLSTDAASRFPVLTCSAGPTNSIRGAAFLSGLQDAVVVDIGGTTTDVGFLLNGFPRETSTPHYIGDVRTNFRMPDVLSIPLGGGTRVRTEGDTVTLGPDSVGFQLLSRARIFGGPDLTTTDIAVHAGNCVLGERQRVADLDPELVKRVQADIHQRLEDAIDAMKTSSRAVPVILVGGGSILVSRPLKGSSEVVRPQHWDVTNAVGAAIALVSGRVDKLYDFGTLGRDAALAQARRDAQSAAIEAGADPSSVEIVEISEIPMMHMRTGSVRVKVRAVGDLILRGMK